MGEHTAHQSFPVLVGLTCDRCKTRHDDVIERQEFLRWKDTAGYGARRFVDGDRLSLDLCQDCVFDVLGQWVQVTVTAFDAPKDVGSATLTERTK